MQPASLLHRLRSGALGNSIIVMGGFLLSRVTGLLRDMIASYHFGTSPEYAAYLAAFRITDLLYLVFIGGALGSSVIPLFIQVWERDGDARAWRLASAVLTWALLALSVASAILFVAAPWLVEVAYGGPEIAPETLTLIVDLARLFLLSPLLLGMGGLAMAALNARDRFGLAALAPTIYNLGIIGGALLAPQFGIWGMAWGVIIGALCYLLIQLPGLFALQMRLRPTLGRDMAEPKLVAQQMGPRVIGQAAAHISAAATLVLAARLPDGEPKIAALAIAYQIMLLPYGLFSLSLSQVAFPRLARLYAEGRNDELAADMRRTLGTILWLTLPAAAALLILGGPLTRVLFQRGEFDALSLRLTTQALLGYATALPAFAVSEIMIRGFYAMQRTWTPVLVGMAQVALNLGLGMGLLALEADVGALALAFSIANNLEALLLLFLLNRHLPGFATDRDLRRTILGSLLASIVLAGLVAGARLLSLPHLPGLSIDAPYQWTHDLPPLLLWLTGIGILGAVCYGIVTAFVGVPAARALLERVGRLRGK
ncbi:MAG: murein biosynthesis integral membrane protein MurJ [Oscillochloris sp.]|nr:murein biosynthesis integral membrane protein MurJ [Oscillochloris sp.]